MIKEIEKDLEKLQVRCDELDTRKENAEMRQIIIDLKDTLRANENGCGLSANQIGYELAMKLTKGNHAFIVATHTDRAHIHNHIIWNSTELGCTRKFRNIIGSILIVQRISDQLCLEHRLRSIMLHQFDRSRG